MPDDLKGGAIAPAIAPVEAPKSPVDASIEPPKPGAEDARLAQLAKRERALAAQRKALQAEKAAFEAARAPKPKTEAEMRAEIREQFLKDPKSVGLSYEDISQRYLTQPSPEEQQFSALKAELQALKDELNETKSQFSSQQDQAYKSAVQTLTREVKLLVDGNDTFEAINANASENQQAIVSLIEQTYKDEGILLSAQKAAQQVEDYLVEQALPFAKLKKVQSRLQPQAPAPVEAPVTPALPQGHRQSAPKYSVIPKTISRELGQAPVSGEQSYAERRAAVIAKIEALRSGKAV